MAYIYRHIRLDTNEPFYIGIANDNNNYNYTRAYKKTREGNCYWNYIVKNFGYEVEIVMDGLTWDQACEKEKEFINLYGRANMYTGVLANLTDGGEGNFGIVMTTGSRLKLSKAFSKKVNQYTLNGEFIKTHDSCTLAAAEIGACVTNISGCANLKKSNYSSGGYVWRWFGEVKSGDIEINQSRLNFTSCKRPIKVYYANGAFFSRYESVTSASVDLGIPTSYISTVLTGKTQTSCGYMFAYDDGNYDKIGTPVYKSQAGEKNHMFGKTGNMKGRLLDNSPKAKTVLQIDKSTGEIIKIHNSIKSAALYTGVNDSCISKCCKGKSNTSGGYKWEYFQKKTLNVTRSI